MRVDQKNGDYLLFSKTFIHDSCASRDFTITDVHLSYFPHPFNLSTFSVTLLLPVCLVFRITALFCCLSCDFMKQVNVIFHIYVGRQVIVRL